MALDEEEYDLLKDGLKIAISIVPYTIYYITMEIINFLYEVLELSYQSIYVYIYRKVFGEKKNEKKVFVEKPWTKPQLGYWMSKELDSGI